MPACACNSILRQIIVIVAIGSAIGIADSYIRPVDLSKRKVPDPPVGPSNGGGSTPTPPTNYAKFVFTKEADLQPGQITVEQAKSLFDEQAFFIDARKPEPYQLGHVKGAYRMAEADFQFGDPKMLALIPRDSTLVVYCSGGHCDESELVARLLTNSGYKKVYVLRDGFPGWDAMGYPSEKGEGQ
jgi:rhodanese-related sulfurtransferase